MDIIAAIEDLQKRVATLEQATLRIMPMGPLPSTPLPGKSDCLFCGEEHGELSCPKFPSMTEAPILNSSTNEELDPEFLKQALDAAIADSNYFQAKYAAAQAKIDALMLEYCPEEMTEEQLQEYERHQKKVDDPKPPASPEEHDISDL